MSVQDRLSTLTQVPVGIAMKGSPDFPQCGFSAKAIAVLRQAGAQKIAHINVLDEPEVRAGLPQLTQWPTFPQIFVGGEFIGGCDITVEMFQNGELAQQISAAQA